MRRRLALVALVPAAVLLWLVCEAAARLALGLAWLACRSSSLALAAIAAARVRAPEVPATPERPGQGPSGVPGAEQPAAPPGGEARR